MPYLGNKLANSITHGDITELLDDVAAKRVDRRQGLAGPASEARTIQSCLNTVFRWAVSERHIDIANNPMLTILKDRHGKTVARDRVLADDEIAAFWTCCDQLGWPYGPIGQLLLLTGQRLRQVAGMRWSELNLQERIWTLPSNRTKNGAVHVVPLSPPWSRLLNNFPG